MEDIFAYNEMIRRLRQFFQDEKGFVEVPSQSRLSIMAACEDPANLSKFSVGGVDFPLPQTGQMWLETELLKNPHLPGVFCHTTSYRDELFPMPGRHKRIFPMFEFESHGGFEELKKLEMELLLFLGFPKPISLSYEDVCLKYGITEIKAEHETRLMQEFGNVISLENFPKRTHPFWNMKHSKDGIYKKIDVILHGMETIGSAERSTNIDEMREYFFMMSDGKYAEILFNWFGRERVLAELEEYLSLPMIPRYGAGIGISPRLERAMQLSGLLNFKKPNKVYHYSNVSALQS